MSSRPMNYSAHKLVDKYVTLHNPSGPLSIGHSELYGLEPAAALDSGSDEERRQEIFSVPGDFQPPVTGLFVYSMVNIVMCLPDSCLRKIKLL